jgi:hypothetical protein
MHSSHFPRARFSDDQLVSLSVQYYYGESWQECGMRTVDGILSALGFQSSDEVAKFCASVNVIEAFSDVEFVRQFINDEDRRDLVRLGQIRNKIKLAPTIFIFKPAGSVFDFKVNPGYDDFFQFLYAYVTRGNSFGERENFIKYWKDNYSKETSYAIIGILLEHLSKNK